MSQNNALAILCVLGLSAASPALATTFSFDAYAPTNATNPLSVTADGLTASFNSPSGAGAFIAEDGSAFSTLGSSVLADDNFAPEELDIGFSQNVAAASFAFATNDSGAATAVTLTALLNGTVIGSVSSAGVIAASGLPEGVLSISAAGFNALQVTDSNPGNEGFAISAVTVSVPEPPTLLLVAAGVLTLIFLRRRA
jgi:hypothetical protein